MKFFRRLLKFLLVLFVLLNIMAAFHAWKFTHFYDDQNLERVKPEEMGIGAKTKAILFGVSYPKSKNAVTPELPYGQIVLTTTDNIKISCWHIKNPAAKGTMLMFHGHGSSKSKILQEATAIYKMGYTILLTDFRAHGNSESNTCTIGFKEANDVKAAYNYIASRGEKNIILWGVSLGAATITRAVSEYQLQPRKIILEMPFGSLEDAVKGRVRMMHLPEQPISALLTFWGGAEQGFWAFSHNPCDYARQITCPVLLQWGKHDLRVSEKETNCIYTNLASKDKQLVVYETASHQSLLNKEPQKWTKAVNDFLSK